MEEVKIPQETVVPTQEPQNENVQAAKKKSRWWLWVIIGVGAAALLTAIVFFIGSLLKSDDIEKVDMDLIPVCKNEKWGYINKKGDFIINPQFADATYFSDGLARVSDSKGNVGYINKKGKYVIAAKYKQGTYFKEGLAFVVAEGGAPTCINKKGKTVFELPQAEGVMEFSEGLATFYTYDKEGEKLYGFVDKKGRVAINPQFKKAYYFCEGMAAVANSEGDFGYIDKKGKYVINPQFEEAWQFKNGKAAVLMGDEWGFIDKKGKYIINPQFEDIFLRFDGKYAAVCQGNKWGFIDEDGKFTINPQFESTTGFLFEEDYAAVKSNDKIGFIDKDGKYVINPQFKFATWFVDGIALAQSGDKWGIINKKGEYTANPQFDDVKPPFCDINFIESDFYDCTEFFNTFLKGFDPSHVDGLSSGACLSDINAIRDMDVSDFGFYSIRLTPSTKVAKEITLSEVRYDFSDRTYNYTDDWFSLERVINGEAEIENITYELELTSGAARKCETIAARLANKLKSIYGGKIIEQKKDYDYNALIVANNFCFVVSCGYVTIYVNAIFDKSQFEKIEKEFSEMEDDDDDMSDFDIDEEPVEEAVVEEAVVEEVSDDYGW